MRQLRHGAGTIACVCCVVQTVLAACKASHSLPACLYLRCLPPICVQCGCMPFAVLDSKPLAERIVKLTGDMQQCRFALPDRLSEGAAHMLRHLLHPDPMARLDMAGRLGCPSSYYINLLCHTHWPGGLLYRHCMPCVCGEGEAASSIGCAPSRAMLV